VMMLVMMPWTGMWWKWPSRLQGREGERRAIAMCFAESWILVQLFVSIDCSSRRDSSVYGICRSDSHLYSYRLKDTYKLHGRYVTFVATLSYTDVDAWYIYMYSKKSVL